MFLRPLAPDKLFSQTVFSKYLKNLAETVSDIKKMYGVELVGLLMLNTLLARHISVPPTVFEIQRLKKKRKK